jgi:hypothetical protein
MQNPEVYKIIIYERSISVVIPFHNRISGYLMPKLYFGVNPSLTPALIPDEETPRNLGKPLRTWKRANLAECSCSEEVQPCNDAPLQKDKISMLYLCILILKNYQ